MQLTQKEKELLKDLKGQEKLCVEKYSQHAAAANDEQLSRLLNYLGGVEQRHLDIITKIDSGEIPQPAAGEAAPKNDFKQTYSVSETQEKKNDCYICSDLLATEKHASALYDTCIFEFKNEQLRTVLNSIGNEFVKMIFVSFLNSNIYPLKNLPTSRVCIFLETPYSKASSHFPIA
ncbi:MAG: spore coat protein, partial [Oscillospiraceae bacterium]|nr:spore coat protein [Oscillospiraceae bacterium]